MSTGAAPRVMNFVFYTLERCITDSTNKCSVVLYSVYTHVKMTFHFAPMFEQQRPVRGAAERNLKTTVHRASDPLPGGSTSL